MGSPQYRGCALGGLAAQQRRIPFIRSIGRAGFALVAGVSMIYILIILHAVDAVLTWRFGRNTEYGILFKNLTGSPWTFWPARIGFLLIILGGCEWYKSAYDNGLYWAAIGCQVGILWAIFSKWKMR